MKNEDERKENPVSFVKGFTFTSTAGRCCDLPHNQTSSSSPYADSSRLAVRLRLDEYPVRVSWAM